MYCVECGQPALPGGHPDARGCRQALLARNQLLEHALWLRPDGAVAVARLTGLCEAVIEAVEDRAGHLPEDLLAELRYALAEVSGNVVPVRADVVA